MAKPDMDVIREIPGYKIILKAILKSQIQQLVEQLASHTEEESVILTASVSDGTLSHLGSDSGKTFLEDHEDIKSQFLGFCLKKHHRKKNQEKERQDMLQKISTTPTRLEGHGVNFPTQRSARFPSPVHHGVHPVALTRASPGGPRSVGIRHEPYHTRPRRPHFDPEMQSQAAMINPPPGRMPVKNQIIKIEPEDPDESKTESTSETGDKRQTLSPSHNSDTSSGVKTETSKKAESESSSSNVPNETPDLKLSDNASVEGLTLDSDFSSLISQNEDSSGTDNAKPSTPQTPSSAPQTPGSSSGVDPNLNVKVEAITESEMELEITGVELGPSQSSEDTMGPQESWAPDMQGDDADYGIMASQAEYQAAQQSYSTETDVRKRDKKKPWNPCIKVQGKFRRKSCSTKSSYTCCDKIFNSPANLKRHRCSEHSEAKDHICDLCGKSFAIQADLNRHMRREMGKRTFKCKTCDFRCFDRTKMQEHEDIHSKVSRYFCDVCGQVFRFGSNLSRHRKIHQKSLPKCDVCGEVFESLVLLEKHSKIH